MTIRPWIACLVMLLPFAAGADEPDPVVGPLEPLIHRPSSEMASVVGRWSADRMGLNRRYPVEVMPSRRERLREFSSAWRKRLAEADFEALSTEGKVDYLLLDNKLKAEIDRLDRDARQYAEIEPLIPFAPKIYGLLEARMRLDPVDGEKSAEALNGIKLEVDAARKAIGKNSKGDTKTKLAGIRAAEAVDGMTRALNGWFTHYDGYDPMFSWWTRDLNRRAEEALREYARILRTQVGGLREGDEQTIVGEPIGLDGLKEDLKAEMIPYSPEELLAIADREFAWCDAEMKKASREMGFGDNWKAALEKVKTMHVPPGDQPRLVRDLAKEAVDFVEKNDLVTVPTLAKEDWTLEMMSPAAQRRNPFFLGGDRIIVSYPTNTMEYADRIMSVRSNNIPFSRATVHHELIPGHHLQVFMTSRYNTHRRVFDTPFWTEGWSLYWEMLLWDKGFPKTPEDRVGMLFWRMHRCARIVFSLKFHLGQMTPEEAIDYLVDRVGHERFSAEGEVRRSFSGGYSPLYQAAYMLGGLQLRALHEDLVGAGKMTDRKFHDRILESGRMPIEMVRVLLTNAPVKRDYEASWKFAK